MKKFLLITFIAIAFIACKKNGNTNSPTKPDDTTPTVKKKLLSKTVNTNFRNITTFEYKFNDKNQLTGIHSFANNSTFVGSDFVFTYNTDGTLKRQERTTDGVYSYRDFSYDNGLPSLITNVDPAKPTETYTIKLSTDDHLLLSGTFYYPPINGLAAHTSTSTFEYLNDNLIKTASVDDAGLYYSESTNEFGTKKNPFLYSGTKFNISVIPFASKNEVTKETQIANGRKTIIEYTYTYDGDGYPIKATTFTTFDVNSVPPTATGTIEYSYIDAK